MVIVTENNAVVFKMNDLKQNKQTIRVLQLIEHLRIGGAERLVCQLYQGLNDAEIQSLVCVYSDKGALGHQLEEQGGKVLFVAKNPRRLMKLGRIFAPIVKIFENIIFIVKLAKLFKQQQVDVVQCHLFSASLWGILAASLLGKKAPIVIVTEHAVREKEQLWYYRLLHRYLLNHATHIVAVSPQVTEALSVFHPNIKTQISIIPNAVTLLPPVSETTQIKLELPNIYPRIVIVGRLISLKRHDLLLKALQRCKQSNLNFCCLIIGEGETALELKALSAELGLQNHVTFMGARQDVASLLAGMNIAVNVSDREGLPISLLEAMAAGLAVVATDVCGNRELVQHNKTGLLCPKGDVEAIANALRVLIQDSELSKQLGQQAQAMIAENYNFETISLRWKELYLQLINKSYETKS